jgi:hypothetical protein
MPRRRLGGRVVRRSSKGGEGGVGMVLGVMGCVDWELRWLGWRGLVRC